MTRSKQKNGKTTRHSEEHPPTYANSRDLIHNHVCPTMGLHGSDIRKSLALGLSKRAQLH